MSNSDPHDAYKKGVKATKTSMFKWSADHLGGSIYFEEAAKGFMKIGDEKMAKDSYIKYAHSSEKIDSLSCAADGYTQAAFLEDDFEKSEKLLKKA